ncbi:MAG: transcription-repair coupling factor [Gemmatimonadetes bacterium]|jgi:transcription-repair coupling factor (superfamily II helicase)|nr:transcription-repair coupling factor [Gemmatimonadota bacterium]
MRVVPCTPMTPSSSLDPIAQKTAQSAPVLAVLQQLQSGATQVLLHGLPSALGAFALTAIYRQLQRPIVLIAADEDRAESWRDDLMSIAGEEAVHYFPRWDIGLYDTRSPDAEISGLRIEAVSALTTGAPCFIVAPAAALLTPVIPPHALELTTLNLRVGQEYALDEITSHLTDAGFESVATVDGVGQFSSRGGILDVYPVGSGQPLRFEFFGDEIESIRRFDITSQRSVGTCEEAKIPPARELVLNRPFYDDYVPNLDAAEKESGVDLSALKDQLETGSTSLDGIETVMALLYGRDEGLFEYFSDKTLLYVEEADDWEADVEKVFAPSHREVERHADKGTHLPLEMLTRDIPWLHGRIDGVTRLQPAPVGQLDSAVRFGATLPRIAEGDLDVLKAEIIRLSREEYEVVILSETQGQSTRLQEIFSEWSDNLVFGLGTLSRGFVFPEVRVAILNDHEIFSRQRSHYRYRRFTAAKPISTFDAMQRGDFVVHVDHGIGRYLGLRRLTISGLDHDCLEVAYQGRDKLFIPVEQLDRLRRYGSAEGDVPLLSKLGSSAWEKLKERTKEEIFQMASELIELYAQRKSLPGFKYSGDSAEMRALEASFPFQETPDQQRTVDEVKKDMEQPNPMDRLVCGDVGYGKTEVAVRAAFKAVCDQKQVAVLVPTTILAQQHYQTFSERMEPFPVRVEVMSRFGTAKDLKRIAEDVKAGKVDVLIGTHRILSKDVQFRDLGLLVVDEEQRFGVKHKERLKQMKRQVDVVTLTATPIPRTMHMSLMGARDMSIINTPPQDRLPIHTEILDFDEGRIVEAIQREISRGGQVYFVHNRVRSIYSLITYLQELLPGARFAVAHGQMPARQLEGIMYDFLERKFDCLVSTMIIESGIDIPSVNTILVNRADMLGLAQLYQIRGRVGRSKERAYAYLMVPKGKRLTRKSRLRLRAVEEFAELGSGFNIAMRDMEIRGAGNLLGAQQHGFITAVGFDLYTRLLDEAVRELKGEHIEQQVEPEIKIAVTAYLPDDYIPDADLKMSLYQRLAGGARIVDLLLIKEEMEDRFGRMPWQAKALFHIMEIKVMARQLGVAAIHLEKTRFRMAFPDDMQMTPGDIQRFVEKTSTQLNFNVGDRLEIETSVRATDEIERLEKARDLLEELL